MNGNSYMWYRSSISLLRFRCGEKGNVRSPASLAPLVVRSPAFRICTAICLRLDHVSPRPVATDVLFY